MFDKLFKKSAPKDAPAAAASAPVNPAVEATRRYIAQHRAQNPLIAAQVVAGEIVDRLMTAMKTEKGIHIESLLSVLGSLAGYACQASLRAELIEGKGLTENQVFTVVRGADGKSYFFGDALNKPLAESQYSVWSLAAGGAQAVGAKEIIDVNAIFAHVASTVGGEAFGIPRIPSGHSPDALPIVYVKSLWGRLLPTVKLFCEQPSEWPIAYGLAIQDVFHKSKGVIDPTLALTIVMESAVPMSKVDLGAG